MQRQIAEMGKVQAELVRMVGREGREGNKENLSFVSPKATIECGPLSPNLSDWVLERINSHRN